MAGRILVGVDGSEGSRRALRWAIGDAAARQATVDALIVWERPYDYGVPLNEERFAAEARKRLTDAVAEVAGERPDVPIELSVAGGDAAQVLCERSGDADLLVVGSRGFGPFARLALGSVSTKCAHHSRCPVVIVHGDEEPDPSPAGD